MNYFAVIENHIFKEHLMTGKYNPSSLKNILQNCLYRQYNFKYTSTYT